MKYLFFLITIFFCSCQIVTEKKVNNNKKKQFDSDSIILPQGLSLNNIDKKIYNLNSDTLESILIVYILNRSDTIYQENKNLSINELRTLKIAGVDSIGIIYDTLYFELNVLNKKINKKYTNEGYIVGKFSYNYRNGESEPIEPWEENEFENDFIVSTYYNMSEQLNSIFIEFDESFGKYALVYNIPVINKSSRLILYRVYND